jgi:hypothetical protein
MQDERGQAKQLICDIVAAAGGKLVGKVRLHKVFYYSHVYSRSWQEGKNGQEFDIYADLLDDQEYRQSLDDGQLSRELVDGVFQPQS